jgi:hypothetical protein
VIVPIGRSSPSDDACTHLGPGGLSEVGYSLPLRDWTAGSTPTSAFDARSESSLSYMYILFKLPTGFSAKSIFIPFSKKQGM